MLSVILTSTTSMQKIAQREWDAIAERIHKVGEPEAPLHLKIKAYHVDSARKDVERQELILEHIGAITVPLLAYLKRIDADGARRFEDVRNEVRVQAFRYYSLVLDPLPARGKAKAAKHCLIATLDIFESFSLVQQQTRWPRTSKSPSAKTKEGGG
jgi:hypothetical protein